MLHVLLYNEWLPVLVRYHFQCFICTIIYKCSIDATSKVYAERKGRYANHSKKNANVATRSILVDNTPRLYFMALKDIVQGDEIMYDYNEQDRISLKVNAWLKE